MLHNVRMGPQAIGVLVKLVKNTPIRKLDVSNNNLGDFGLVYVLTAVKTMPGLKFVNTACNGIAKKGALEIAKMLTTNTSVCQIASVFDHDVDMTVFLG
jgi:Ran GTPase-activating protein (RanGAP) involved in mRNA processing and transport